MVNKKKIVKLRSKVYNRYITLGNHKANSINVKEMDERKNELDGIQMNVSGKIPRIEGQVKQNSLKTKEIEKVMASIYKK
jgi:hypothetical protein